jgi:hypothetical protein
LKVHIGTDQYWVPIVFGVCVLVGWIVAVRVLVLNDRVLRRLHERHRELWEGCGAPRGVFWRPPGTSNAAHSFANWRVINRALSAASGSGSHEVGEDADLRALLRQRRKLHVALGAVVCMAVLAWTIGLLLR